MINWLRLFLPIPISLVIFIILCLTKTVMFATAFLGGAIVCWLGEICFAALLYKKMQRKRPKGFMWLFSIAETLKLVIYAIGFVVAIVVLRLQLLPVFVGFLLNLILFWILSFKALGDI